ncbi:amidohydrolase [Halalkalibacter urbisdiaboli]|uniref:amidohydrolase n=1 Tax=Halalkalibacter urbisdiaboli TaxID=1960589 RepID=UPI000B439B40|nr:amidohydrolase [Halalkalibacter urbisdiaboli]
MSLLLTNVKAVTMDEDNPFLEEGYVFIQNGVFEKIEEGKPPVHLRDKANRILNTHGKWLMPGLVNTHGHMGMTLLRGHSDDLPLHRWLQEKMWPFEAKLDQKAVEAGRALAMAEMIKSGTTTFLEMYHLFMDDFAEEIKRVGLRATLMRSMIGLCPKSEQEEKLKEAVSFAKNWHQQADGRIRTMLAPHAPYTCPISFVERIVEEAKLLNIPVHMHLAETKKEIDDYIHHHGLHPLDELEGKGLLAEVPWLFAHGVHLSDAHIELLRKYKAAVSHNPISNLKLGSGVAPVVKMLEQGVTVSLGTDSTASNNTLDMFEEMRMTALIHKGVQLDSTILPAKTTLKLGTVSGAKALQLEDIGRIAVGCKADFLLLATSSSHLQPEEHVMSHLIYSVKSTDVTDVYVEGNPLMENRELITLDEEKIMAEANEHYKRICKLI